MEPKRQIDQTTAVRLPDDQHLIQPLFQIFRQHPVGSLGCAAAGAGDEAADLGVGAWFGASSTRCRLSSVNSSVPMIRCRPTSRAASWARTTPATEHSSVIASAR
jgi:hypothetical protein